MKDYEFELRKLRELKRINRIKKLKLNTEDILKINQLYYFKTKF